MPLVDNSRPREGGAKRETFSEYNRRVSGADAPLSARGGGDGYAIYQVAGNMGVPKNIHEASERGNMGVLNSYLREDKSIINNLDEWGRTALMWAAENCHVNIVKRLLEVGATVLIEQEGTGRSSVHWACKGGSREVLETLKAAVVHSNDMDRWVEEINRPDKDGHTPITISKASLQGQEAFLFLLECGAKYNSQSLSMGGAAKVFLAGAKFKKLGRRRQAAKEAAAAEK